MSQLPSDQLTSASRLPGFLVPRCYRQARLNRREALKFIAVGAAVAGLPSAVAGQSADADFTDLQSTPPRLSASLTIEIFTGSATPEDTVLLSSAASHPLMLMQFAPGLIAIAGHVVDLNQILAKDGLIIGTGAVRAVSAVSLLRRQPDTVMPEYLSADSAVQKIGDGAEVVTLHAVVNARGQAVVYIPQPEGVTGIT